MLVGAVFVYDYDPQAGNDIYWYDIQLEMICKLSGIIPDLEAVTTARKYVLNNKAKCQNEIQSQIKQALDSIWLDNLDVDHKPEATHYVILATTYNRDTSPLISVHHDRDDAIRAYRDNENARICHYYYKLVEIGGDQVQETIRSEYFDQVSLTWKPTSELY